MCEGCEDVVAWLSPGHIHKVHYIHTHTQQGHALESGDALLPTAERVATVARVAIQVFSLI